jgi:methyl-accepting chemotaxis protein
MNSIKNISISAKMAAGYIIVIAMLIIVAGLSITRLTQLSSESSELSGIQAERNRLAQEWRSNTYLNGARAMAVAQSSDPNVATFFADAMKKTSAETNLVQKRMTEIETTEEGTKLIAEVVARRAAWLETRDAILKLKQTEPNEVVLKLANDEFVPRSAAYLKSLDLLHEYEGKTTETAGLNIVDFVKSTRTIIVVVALAAILVAVLLAWIISRSITRPLNNAVDVARRVADGDLTMEVVVTSSDETGQLLAALKHMTESLRKIVGEVRIGTDTIATASSEIATGNLDLSSRTEQQAASIEETASSMEELTSTVKQNADNAAQANTLVHNASDIAVRGGQVVSEVVSTMEDITSSSKKIVDIIAVIDGIAFQTNILALNAAVEAARAGEQGRGFAVVAAEVRTLAQRSAGAAKEIKLLIDDSVSKVSTGSALVARAGATMDEIVNSVKHVTDIMAEIAAASREQSSGIEEVNRAIAQMDEVTQQNAALVEEAAAAAGSLQEQSARLEQVVGGFKLDARAMRAASAAVASSSAGSTQARPARPARPVSVAKSTPAARAVPRKIAVSKKQPAPAMAGNDWEEF